MLTNVALINYLTRVVNALDTNTLHPDAPRTNRCPECDEDVRLHDSGHLVWAREPFPSEAEIVLIVACEGYWVINPNLVGIDNSQWLHPDDEFPRDGM